MEKIPLAQETQHIPDGHFGIVNGGGIKIVTKDAKLKFIRDGTKINMLLSLHLTFEENYRSEKSTVAIGPEDVKFNQFGQFKFDEESSLANGGSFDELFLFVDPENDGSDRKYQGIMLTSNNPDDFAMKTTAEKIEHGTGFNKIESAN